MARRPTRPPSHPESPDEPPAEMPASAPSDAQASIESEASPDTTVPKAAGQPQSSAKGPSVQRPGRPATGGLSGGFASRRVAAAAAAAGAAASGSTAPIPSAAVPGAEPVGTPASSDPEPAVAASGLATTVETPPPIPASAAAAGPAPRYTTPGGAAAAAAFAVSAALAATNAARAAQRGRGEAGATGEPATAPGASPAVGVPPAVVQGYQRPPAKESPSIIRARHDESDAMVEGPASGPPEPATPNAESPHQRYVRRPTPDTVGVPEVPGIVRAAADTGGVTVQPPPLFSNEGIVREAQSRGRARYFGPLGGVAAGLAAVGTALGHNGGPDRHTQTLVAGPDEILVISTSPDFDRKGNPRPRTHHRKTGAMLAALTLILAIVAVAFTAALPPVDRGPDATGSPGTSPKRAAVVPSHFVDSSSTGQAPEDTSAWPSGMVLGDESLPPGATRQPGKTTTRTPAPPNKPGPSPTPPGLTNSTPPGSSAYPSSTPTGTPTPTPTHSPTHSPTPVPTPTPTPEMFTLVYSVSPPAVSPGDGTFYVASLPHASCNMYRLAASGDNHLRKSKLFSTDDSGWAYVMWGASWNISNVTVTIYAKCTAATPDTRTAQAANVTAHWPPKASPTPSAF